MNEEIKSQYAPEMQFVECQEKCGRCTSPLHYKIGQGIAFCWECTVDRENAKRGVAVLARLKIEVLKTQTRIEIEVKPVEKYGVFAYGMPL